MDRQKGGVGLRGAGERQSEIDKRLVGQKMRLTCENKPSSRRRETGRKVEQEAGSQESRWLATRTQGNLLV